MLVVVFRMIIANFRRTTVDEVGGKVMVNNKYLNHSRNGIRTAIRSEDMARGLYLEIQDLDNDRAKQLALAAAKAAALARILYEKAVKQVERGETGLEKAAEGAQQLAICITALLDAKCSLKTRETVRLY